MRLGEEEQVFVLDWLADHGSDPSDDAFIAAALTARLVIEQKRAGDRLRTEMTNPPRKS
jgi:hypothetical protein